MLDLNDELHIAFAIHPLARRRSFGLDPPEFGFPESENMGREIEEVGNFSDFKIEFVGDIDRHVSHIVCP